MIDLRVGNPKGLGGSQWGQVTHAIHAVLSICMTLPFMKNSPVKEGKIPFRKPVTPSPSHLHILTIIASTIQKVKIKEDPWLFRPSL